MMTPADGAVMVKIGGGMPDARTVQVEEGKVAHLDFGAGAAGATVSGRVLRGGRPYAGTVSLVPASAAGTSFMGMKQARCDEQGRYRIEGVAAGEYAALLEPTSRRRVRVGEDPEMALDLDLPRSRSRGSSRTSRGTRSRASR
jgi:hypothetical protein